ncbi:hypothetical protein ON010_g19035 [Phytophthora cinnamomi]|nr:hypothetical protein ON010_g19035 [Phytophthora cinnamomi]
MWPQSLARGAAAHPPHEGRETARDGAAPDAPAGSTGRPHQMERAQPLATAARPQPLSYSLELLVRWFNREFQEADEVQAEASEADLMTESSLMDVFFTREGRDYELVMLFAALCGALQLRYRLTCALDPLLVQKGKAFESSFKQRPSKRRRTRKVADSLLKKKTWSDGGDEEEKQEVEEELDPEGAATADRVFWLWCEVLDEKTKSWVHVDAVRRLVGRPQEVELLRGKAARFSGAKA